MNEKTTITVSRNELLRALNQVAPARGTKVALDVYKCYIFDIQDGKLLVMASNADCVTVRKEVKTDSIETASNERLLFPMEGTIRTALKLLDEQPLQLTFLHSQVEVKHQYGSFFMPLEREDGFFATFPEKEKAQHTVNIEIPDFRHFLDDTAFCMADDELRPVMNGVCFDFKDEHLVMAASDGHMLAMVDAWSVATEWTGSFVVPKKTVIALQRMLPKVGWIELSVYDRYVRMDVTDNLSGALTIKSSTVDGRYPNYLSVIPKENALHITANRKQLLAAVRRADLFANYSSKMLAFYLTDGGNEIEIKSDDIDYEMGATERVPASYGKIPTNKFSPNFRIGFKSTPVEEILRHIKDTDVVINAQNGNRAVTITKVQKEAIDDETLYLLMPMLVND